MSITLILGKLAFVSVRSIFSLFLEINSKLKHDMVIKLAFLCANILELRVPSEKQNYKLLSGYGPFEERWKKYKQDQRPDNVRSVLKWVAHLWKLQIAIKIKLFISLIALWFKFQTFRWKNSRWQKCFYLEELWTVSRLFFFHIFQRIFPKTMLHSQQDSDHLIQIATVFPLIKTGYFPYTYVHV